jgi:rare lipoprotein A
MPSKADALCAALLLVACTGGNDRAVAAPAGAFVAYDASGLASWYGDELAGSRTASGVRFDPAGVTAAHRSLPLGSFVEVTSVATGRSIIVLINDRGPGRKDRLIDLSRGAAQQLGFDGRSTANVRIRAVTPSAEIARVLRAGRSATPTSEARVARVANDDPRPLTSRPLPALIANRPYFVQIATFSNKERAEALAQATGAVVSAAGNLWRVRIGPLVGAKAVQRARDAVANRGYGDARILPAD